MQTIIISRNEVENKPREGVFWIIGDTLIAFTEPLGLLEGDWIDSFDGADPISYLSFEHCWNYLKKKSLNTIITKHDCNFYPRGKITVLENGKDSYIATVHGDRILSDESYYEFINKLPIIYSITNCNIQYLWK